MGRAGKPTRRKVRTKFVGEVISMTYHRNGISGEGFWAIIFEGPKANMELRGMRFIATFFSNDEKAVRTAVLRMDCILDGDTTQTMRGDLFHDELAELVKNYDYDARKPGPDRRGAVEHSRAQVSGDSDDK